MTGFVYFLGLSDYAEESWVKIGFTSGNVYARRNALQTGSPYPLEVLAFAPGSQSDEALLHARFEAFRGSGEWFALDGSLRAYVNDLTKQFKPMQPARTLWTDVYQRELVA